MKQSRDLYLSTLILRRRLSECTLAEYETYLDAAAAAGCRGICLATLDHRIARAAGKSDAELVGWVRARGLATPIVEAVLGWAQGQDDAAIEAEVGPAVELAAHAGAKVLTAVSLDATLDLEVAAKGFRRVCEIAARAGLDVALEFLPWGAIPEIRVAWELALRAGAPNGGILLDTWHWHRRRGGPDFATLERIPGDRILVLQLSDAAEDEGDDLMRESIQARLLPGEGAIDYARLFDCLERIGANPLVAPEVFNRALAERGPVEMACRVADASRSVLAAATLGSGSG
jgi:sugar phosphate isomerase/epimerase